MSSLKPDQSSSSAIVRPASEALEVWDDVRLQKLWLAANRRPWRSLAVVGADDSVETQPVAELLAQLAWRYRGEPSSVFDLRTLSMRLVDYHVRELRAQVDSGLRVVIALNSIFHNPTTSPMAREADAVLLCVTLGTTKLREAEQTIAEVGREKLLGCVIVRTGREGGKQSDHDPIASP